MKVSVITVCRNAAETIGCALASVRSQALPPGVELEHIVIDGLSTDGTVEIISAAACETAEAAFSLKWISERDRGLYDAMNKGIARATGEIVGILNADDVLASDMIVTQIAAAFAEGGDAIDATWGDVRFVRGGATVEGLRAANGVRYCTGRFFRRWMFRFATFPAHPSTFIRKTCFTRFGLYRIDYPICADFEMMLRLFWKHRIRARYLPICTTVMRTGGVSTRGFKSMVEINREDLRALRMNGCWSCLPLIYLKYAFKVWGLIRARLN